MKSLTIIFALLTVYLSAVPCCTEDVFLVDHHQDCADSSEHENEPCEEPCSPFYSCGSCTGFSVQEVSDYNFVREKPSLMKIISLDHFSIGKYHPSSFRPPRA